MPSFRNMVVALLAGAGVASSAIGAPKPQAVAADAAPPAWTAYAAQVNTLVTGWLGGEEPGAVKLRADLDATRAAADQASAPVTLRLWIDAKGIITRAVADPVAAGAPELDVALLAGRAIGTRPPKGMLLPLRLAVQLEPPPPPIVEP
jgi:hypothetical protein